MPVRPPRVKWRLMSNPRQDTTASLRPLFLSYTSVLRSFGLLFQVAADMAGVSPDLLWQLVKKNNKFLVKRNGNSSASVQFSCEPNNLFSLNTFKYSGLANKKTVSITPGSELSVFLGTTKTKKGCKPKDFVNRSLLKRDVRRMATVVVNQVATNGYRPDLKKAALAKLSSVHKSLRVAKSGAAKKSTKSSRKAIRN